LEQGKELQYVGRIKLNAKEVATLQEQKNKSVDGFCLGSRQGAGIREE
jgi:hypothetical protein